MPQPIEMGPVTDRSNVLTEEAVRTIYTHVHVGEEDNGGPVKQVEVFFPINDGCYIPMCPRCPVCDIDFYKEMQEVVRVR